MLLVVGGVFSYLSPAWGIPVLVGLLIFSIVLLLRAYNNRDNNNTKVPPQVGVLSAYQSKTPSKKAKHINFDIEFSLKISTPSAFVAKIQVLSGAEFLEVNSPVTPLTQTNEIESYVANIDIDYFSFLSNTMANHDYILCVLVSGSKCISKKFNFGNASTILMDNKPEDFNLKINN